VRASPAGRTAIETAGSDGEGHLCGPAGQPPQGGFADVVRGFSRRAQGAAEKQAMTVQHDFPFTLTPDEVALAQYRRPPATVPSALLEAAQEAVRLARTLAAPAAVYDWFPLREVAGEKVWLDRAAAGARLTVGPHADLLAPARQVLVAVYTIGPALEGEVRRLHETGEDLLAFMLDSAGVLALGGIGERLRQQAEEYAARQGWGLSPALAPGSLAGWPIQGQRELCALLPLEEIGVRLNDLCVLEPQKSVSLVIGVGPGYPAAHVGSLCACCALADTCWRRRDESPSRAAEAQTGVE
jgi:hypothetical protein